MTDTFVKNILGSLHCLVELVIVDRTHPYNIITTLYYCRTDCLANPMSLDNWILLVIDAGYPALHPLIMSPSNSESDASHLIA